jgi:cyclopropane fatty-acyl-phospholipid synthase-like methyltransferase
MVVTELLAVHAGAIDGLRVLDVGCGWPQVSWQAVAEYVTIGATADILRVAHHPRPIVTAIHTRVAWFVYPRRFDRILVGPASALQPEELKRLPSLLAPGGQLILVFGKSRQWRMGVGRWRPGLWTTGVQTEYPTAVVVVEGGP